MIVVGIYPGHNAAVAIVRDGEVSLNWELERFTRRKHDFGLNEHFVQHCLDVVGVDWNDVELVAMNGWGSRKLGGCPPMGGKTHELFDAHLCGRTLPAVAVNHHLAHVASAFYTSPFDSACVLTLDGGGDAENASLAYGVENRIAHFQPIDFEDLAGWWSSVTLNNYRMPRLHEWDPGSGAGKIMALAAYGKRDAAIDAQLLSDMARGPATASPTFTDPSSWAFNGNEDLSDTKQPRAQALAAYLQDYTTDVFERQFEIAYRTHRSSNLCFAGGLALNCVANSRAFDRSPFTGLHVPPCPNDTGLALGMALYAYHHIYNRPRTARRFSPFTGPPYDSARIAALAQQEGGRRVTPPEVAAALQMRPVAVWRGRSECGPRALGHRSILAITDSPTMRSYLNEKVKLREWYRPFAPIVLAERSTDLFIQNGDSPYMAKSKTIRQKWREQLAAVCHVDNTTRPQTLCREDEPFIYDVIRAVEDVTVIPAVLNTSFNRQCPIVETPEEALALFKEMPLQYLLLDDYLISKGG